MTTAPNTLSGKVRAAVADAVAQAGLIIESVDVTQGRRPVVQLTVDLPDGPGGVSSDQIADVSRAVSEALDAADVVPGAYTLEVSTPGADRPLTEPRHFRRAVGRLVKVTTADGTVTERLTDVVGDVLHLGEDDVRQVPIADVTRARVEIELRRGR